MSITKTSKLQSASSNRILLGPPGLLLAATCLSLLLGLTCALGERDLPVPRNEPHWTGTDLNRLDWIGATSTPPDGSQSFSEMGDGDVLGKEVARF